MKAAILCPGPSLAALTEPPAADLIIGVNRAAARFTCHVWAALDYQTVQEVKPLGSPRLFTLRTKYAPGDAIIAQTIDAPPQSLGWLLFTTTAAMALAYHLGARHIEVFGNDLMGEADYDGRTPDRRNRTDTRWATERERQARIIGWLKEHGTEITRGTAR